MFSSLNFLCNRLLIGKMSAKLFRSNAETDYFVDSRRMT